ncbi:LPS-assembly lipoprotein [Endobacter medicaginis]|uniref:LPS-assembly lipoprotein n=1 Tax=Endobacter medicaginis TaxID=1181271 RepID=A0A850NSN9_9PROT|nr:LPS assembly lipoprotein LptE [Endobacter medicaginis]MBB3172302.1 LPS-assembly lipoprotein [Endobacter medicaginis]MCX5474579.1 LPS assembly lipoprotein LptE [Endobacter medicaginis]NVN30355.1 hypothetical protein [Endobacter medicaginis]
MRHRPGAASLLVTALALAGCGFHPLYGPQDGPGGAVETSVNQKLSRVYVNPIMERSGQLLRQALQARLGGDGDSQSQTYRLSVAPMYNSEFLGIHGDNSPARVRVSADARWSLVTVSATPVLVATGRARTMDGFNIIDEQYFNSQLAGESTNARIAGQLADRVVQQLAIWFRDHPDGKPQPAVSPVQLPKPSTQPGFLNYRPVPGDDGQTSTQPVGPDGMPAGALGLQAPIGAH